MVKALAVLVRGLGGRLMEWDAWVVLVSLSLALAIPAIGSIIQHFTRGPEKSEDEDDWWRRIK